MPKDYALLHNSDKRVPEWQFKRCIPTDTVINFIKDDMVKYENLESADYIVEKYFNKT